ncbi:hypothetical protein CWR48_06455 [Oceanobacillus arenosus]|uniref:Uncharacterized protein n=1 Tax=Oceanobacillus arenosus TaxID=1229153 RepID=A0A3D8PW52_9BACI|nr:hypothetical protein CWR48_06455 [Oceanobacillus arenosus]
MLGIGGGARIYDCNDDIIKRIAFISSSVGISSGEKLNQQEREDIGRGKIKSAVARRYRREKN